MHIRNAKDFWAGLMFAGFGLFFAGFGSRYTFGSAARMGPGYFPTMLGALLILLGAVVALKALSPRAEEHRVAKFSWPVISLILGPVLLFGLLLNKLGLVLCLAMLVIISSLASHEFGWRAALINAVVLILLCLAVFVYALKLQFPLWPAFTGA
jgi:hypothetical protein